MGIKITRVLFVSQASKDAHMFRFQLYQVILLNLVTLVIITESTQAVYTNISLCRQLCVENSCREYNESLLRFSLISFQILHRIPCSIIQTKRIHLMQLKAFISLCYSLLKNCIYIR